MENLSLFDAPAQGGLSGSPLHHGTSQPPPPLPPQMFTTAAQLLDFTDKKLMVILRDGRKLIGVLRSWDQFANLILQSTTERIYATRPDGLAPDSNAPAADDNAHDNNGRNNSSRKVIQGLYAEIPRGTFLVRGENVLLLGEIDLDKDDEPPPGYEMADVKVVEKLADEKRVADKAKDKLRANKLSKLGFESENLGDIIL